MGYSLGRLRENPAPWWRWCADSRAGLPTTWVRRWWLGGGKGAPLGSQPASPRNAIYTRGASCRLRTGSVPPVHAGRAAALRVAGPAADTLCERRAAVRRSRPQPGDTSGATGPRGASLSPNLVAPSDTERPRPVVPAGAVKDAAEKRLLKRIGGRTTHDVERQSPLGSTVISNFHIAARRVVRDHEIKRDRFPH